MNFKRVLLTSLSSIAFLSLFGQGLCSKQNLSIGDVITLTAPASSAQSLRWELPKGYLLQGKSNESVVTVAVTYYAQSGEVKLIRQFEDGTEQTTREQVTVLRPISQIKDVTITDGQTVVINGAERSEADIYYEPVGDNQLLAHRLTVLPKGGQRVMKPYLQTVSENSIYVTWKSSINETATLYYGLSENDLTNTVTVSCSNLSLSYFWYSIQLTGLQPNTLYYYRIASPQAYSESSGQSPTYRFKTAPLVGEKKKTRVLLMGDHQIKTRSGYEWLMQAAKRKVEEKYGKPIEEAIDLVLNIGDQVDVGTLQQYEEIHFYKSQLLSPFIPTMTVVGNHETYSDIGLATYSRHFHYENLVYKGIKSNTENYYAYQLGRTLYVCLSTEHTGAEQKGWVRKVVDAAKTDDTVDFIISVNHRPVQAEQYIGDISAWARNEIMPILSETPKHVLNYGGHHHLYHRGQFPDFPLYHIINGAASWDQMWGMSSEKDFDDVQKTVDYWTYQIVEFDYEKKTMHTECYAIGNKMLVVDNLLIDTFDRQLDQAAPKAPTMDEIPAKLTLPYAVSSSKYESATEFDLNTVQYQISTNQNFSSLVKNIIRDVENLYGSTKAPLYLPVDINEGLDITKLQLEDKSLKNGVHYIRVRYRDTNMEWSEWSAVKSFEVQGSIAGDPSISIPRNVYALNENVWVDYEFAPENKGAWIGIYKKGDVVAMTTSTRWKATTSASGKINLGTLTSANEYFVVLFKDGGYIEITNRIPFYVGPSLEIKSDKMEYKEGEKIQISYANTPALSKDWIGIYRVGMNPEIEPSLLWAYTSGASGNLQLENTLSKGYYFATYMLKNAYFEPAERIYFSVGSKISTISATKSSYAPNENIVVNYGSGPGTPKDWIGIYEKSKDVEVDELNGFYYTYSKTDGQITIPAGDVPAGEYFLSFFINDSYTEVSERAYISVGKAPELRAVKQGDQVVVYFEDNTSWKDSISQVLINNLPVDEAPIEMGNGEIRIPLSYFEAANNTLVIKSRSWLNAETTIDLTTVSITDNTSTSVLVYPNPFDSEFCIDNTSSTFEHISILSVTGEELFHHSLQQGKNTIRANQLASGTYLLHLVSGNEKKIVVLIRK